MTKEQIIILIVGVVLLVGLAVFLFIYFKYFKKSKKETLKPEYVDKLYEYLGGKTNIKSLSLQQRRLSVFVNDAKEIDQNGLRELGISAFLKGTELKILVSDEPQTVYDLLVKKHKGE